MFMRNESIMPMSLPVSTVEAIDNAKKAKCFVPNAVFTFTLTECLTEFPVLLPNDSHPLINTISKIRVFLLRGLQLLI